MRYSWHHSEAGAWSEASREASREAERRNHRRGVELLPDIFGPWAHQTLSPVVLHWKDGCIRKLATAMKNNLDFSIETMGVLGDALEESGLATDEMVLHCRQPGQIHLSDCWLFRLLMGKK